MKEKVHYNNYFVYYRLQLKLPPPIDKHSSMLNVTARLAVKVQNLPDWEVDWDDITPQCSRSSLTCDNFLPSIDDATALEESALQYTMEFLTQEFDSLSDLKQYSPPRNSPHQSKTPTVAFCSRTKSTRPIQSKLSGNSWMMQTCLGDLRYREPPLIRPLVIYPAPLITRPLNFAVH